ncbi:MAG TPA: hypothetical protein VEI97_20700, partial [bacterium]|nr:hypothetical protein [bacterium]
MALPRRPLPLLLLAAALLTHITVACARERPPVGRALVDTFAVHDLNAQLLEAVELHPRTLAGETVVGRALGPLTLDGQTAAWVDPEVGIRLIDLASPGTRQAEPRPLAVLVPRQRPGACVVLQGAVVVQSAEGPFALELFLQDPEDPASWSWAGAVQRGHYAAIHAAGPQRVLAWDQADNALDLWVVDRGRGTLSPAWHWPLPEPTEALAVDGEYLALAVHGTTFDVGGRPRTGSGVALYGLDADPAGPVLYDRWKSPHDDPGLGLLWYGRGLVATQPQALHLLQRDQRSLLQPLGALP